MRREHRESWFLRCGISKERYAELRAICRQYDQMKREVQFFKRPRSSYIEKIAAIEDSAGYVDRVLAPYIIDAVKKIHWRYGDIRPPCGERQFRHVIHLFYQQLDKILE